MSPFFFEISTLNIDTLTKPTHKGNCKNSVHQYNSNESASDIFIGSIKTEIK